jgi:glycosyltransferase involved in cell wall biosynthesis
MVLALLRHLSQAAPEVEFVLLTSEKNHEELAVLEAANVQRCCMTQRRSQAHALLTAGGLPWDMQADLLFFPFTAPFFADPAMPAVSVVYDLQYLYYPQFFSPEASQERDTHFRHAAQQAKHLICISDYVRQTVLDHTEVQPEDITTIHIGLPRKATQLAPEPLIAVLERLGLRAGRFLLYPANFWPHKNHRMLLTAFKMYRARNQDSDLGLVCTGTPNADMECLRDAVARMELEGAVSFPGYVSDEVFTALLQACRALIFPSLYEGFGIPVLEAMALGKPVLCSRVTSLPEVAGDAAVYFDPRKPAEIVRAIEHIESDAELAARLMHQGYERLATFGDASEMAQRYLQVFREVVHDFPYPPYTLHGIYADGWIGSRAVIAYGASADQRHLELVLTLPAGTPYPWVAAEVQHNGYASTVPCILTYGKEEHIRLELSHQESAIELLLIPAFQPRAHAMGEDMRMLGCLCRACRIVSAHATEDLLAGRG